MNGPEACAATTRVERARTQASSRHSSPSVKTTIPARDRAIRRRREQPPRGSDLLGLEGPGSIICVSVRPSGHEPTALTMAIVPKLFWGSYRPVYWNIGGSAPEMPRSIDPNSQWPALTKLNRPWILGRRIVLEVKRLNRFYS